MATKHRGRKAAETANPVPAVRPEPTEKERQAIAEAKERYDKMPLRPDIDVGYSEAGVTLAQKHSDSQGGALVTQATLGTSSAAFGTASLIDLINVAHHDGEKCQSDDLSAALAFVAAVDPQNEMESALAQQMYAVHRLSMTMAIKAGNAQIPEHANHYINSMTKLQRTMTAQIEALSKWRRGGVQEVRHTHTYIDNRGGQAVIAETVNTGGANEIFGQVHGQHLQGDGGSTLPGQDATGHGMPVSGDEERPLRSAWGQVDGGAEGK